MNGDSRENDSAVLAAFIEKRKGKGEDDGTASAYERRSRDHCRSRKKEDACRRSRACARGNADYIGGSERIAENGLIYEARRAERKAAEYTYERTAEAQHPEDTALHFIAGENFSYIQRILTDEQTANKKADHNDQPYYAECFSFRCI
jgi:hypothetical protein